MNSQSQRQTPMFSKVILENILKQGRLEIPSRFVIECGNSLSNPVILRVPNGRTWEVRLSRLGEEVWLRKGLVDFFQHHSLEHGHLLVFKYEGNSRFNVLIFDMTAMEIDHTGTSRDTNNEEFRGNVASSSRDITTADNFNSSSPWFKIRVTKNKYLTVPYSFTKNHTDCEPRTVMFKVEDKSWPVKLNVYPDKSVSVFSGGVISFLRGNALKDGDVCIFELIANSVFNVSIFRI